MIRSWKNSSTRQLWQHQKSGSLPGLDVGGALNLLLALNICRYPDDLVPLKSAGLRREKGSRAKRWTMKIDGRWRIRFDSRKGDAFDVKVVGAKTDKASDKKRRGKITPGIIPAVHPGGLLKRELTARELSASRLALDIGVPSGRITDILNARRAITADTAVRLGRYLGMSAQFWCDLQSQFDIAIVERKKGSEIGRRVRVAAAT
ncbi:MAG: plasmid maintenance system antidote protein family [Tardiphaga sp.]|nr:plasmid maintenance system antidote protein family [Tardiphaga sp.]